MKRDDIDFAVNVANKEGWEYERRDMKRLKLAFADGLFLAEDEGRRLGWMIACLYGRFVWIGSLVVDSAARRQGVGSALMRHALEYADEQRARTVALYAYREAIPFYERMGLRKDCEFLLLEGASEGEKRYARASRGHRIENVLSLDKKYFRADRSRLLEALREESERFFMSCKGDRGYIFGRKSGNGSAEIGPWVCEPDDSGLAESLLEAILTEMKSGRIGLVAPASNAESLRILARSGFEVKRTSLRMYKGVAEDLPRTDGIYAAAGWDVG